MELDGIDRSPSAASNDSSSSSSSSSTSNSSASTNHGHNSNSLRGLDELLMGGNDLDALSFEFGCDFSAAFEDKYLLPPLSTASASRLAAFGAEAGFGIVPPLSASLQSPSTNFHLCSPPARFLHGDYARIRALSTRNSTTSMSVLSFDRKLDAAASRCSSAASHSAHSESMLSSPRCTSKNDFGTSRASTPDGSELSEPTSSRGSKATHIGRWTKKEHELFLEGLKLYGKSWKKISSLVVTRTLVQIRTHAQKYLQKQAKNAQKAAAAAAPYVGGAADATADSSRHQSQQLGQSFGEHFDAWKGAPISFPGLLPAHSASSTSSSSSSSIASFSQTPESSSYVMPAVIVKRDGSIGMCKLEQLLQDEPSQYVTMDGYYQSPMGTDDEILQEPTHATTWSRSNSRDAGAASSALPSSPSLILSLPDKRRRLDPLQQLVNPMEAMTSSATADTANHHTSMFALGAHQLASNSLYGGMDFSQTPQQLQQHAYAASAAQLVNSAEYTTAISSSSSNGSSSYGSWQLS